eukprot:jgi/Tetstr1/460245/TSEL_000480.t1
MAERILAERLLELARAHVEDMDGVGVATVLWGVAKLGMEHVALLEDLEEVLPYHLGDLSARHVANVAWAYGTLGRRPPPEVLEALLEAVDDSLGGLSSQGVANTAWALARLELAGAAETLDGLERRALSLLRRQPPPGGPGGPTMPLPGAFPGRPGAPHRGGRFNPQEVANLAWALATLRRAPSEQLLHHIAAFAAPRLRDFRPQELANLAWALATMAKHGVPMPPGLPRLLAELEAHALTKLRALKPLEVSQVLMAFAVLAPIAAAREGRGGAERASIPAGGMGSGATLAAAVGATTATNAQAFGPLALGNTLYALARLRHNPGRATLEAILQPASARELSDFSDMSLSMVLWSCAQLHFDGQREVLAAMLQELARREAPEPSVVSQSMWAAAVLELLTPELFSRLAELFARRLSEANPRELRAVWQAYKEVSAVAGAVALTPEMEQLLLRASWNAKVKTAPLPSRAQKEVAVALRLLGVEHRVGAPMPDGRTVDLLLPRAAGPPVALQVDEPWYYAANDPAQPLGSRVLRDRALTRAWLHVVVLPAREWLALPSAAQRTAALEELLAPLGVLPEASGPPHV